MTGPSRAADPSYQQGGTADRRFLALWLEAASKTSPSRTAEMLLPVVSAGNGPARWPCRHATPGWVDESGCRPGSVPRRRCRRRGDGHPSRVAVADHLQRPTRVLGRAALERTLSGLAPDGVYRADLVTQVAGGLLHHRFTLAPAARAPGAVCSLWHCPAGHPGWLLATILPFGARTFLGGGCPPTRPSARLVRRQCRGRGSTASAVKAHAVDDAGPHVGEVEPHRQVWSPERGSAHR